jgi:hypothetical protein
MFACSGGSGLDAVDGPAEGSDGVGDADAGGEADGAPVDGDGSVLDTSDSGDTGPDAEDGLYDEVFAEVTRGRLSVTESEEVHVPDPEDGRILVRTLAGVLPAAFSGSVYQLALLYADGASPEVEDMAVVHLVPGGDVLDFAWVAEATDPSGFFSVAWTGRQFVVAGFFGADVGDLHLEVVSLAEDGTVVGHDEDVLPRPGLGSDGRLVAIATTDDPFLLVFGAGSGGSDRIYRLASDGLPTGGSVDVDLPEVYWNAFTAPCTAAGASAVCGTPRGVLFVDADGTHRESDVLPPGGPCSEPFGCGVAFTGEFIVQVGLTTDETDKRYLGFARFGLDGRLLSGPVTSLLVGDWNTGVHVASSGDSVFVVCDSASDETVAPDAFLLDLDGAVIGGPIPIATCPRWTPLSPPICRTRFGGQTNVFWEGSSYSAIWGARWASDAIPNGAIAYRQFHVLP